MKQENNGVYFGRRGYLFEKLCNPDKERLDLHIQRIRVFLSKHENIPSYVLITPTAAWVYPEFVPFFSTSADQKKLFDYIREGLGDDINVIDVFKGLKDYKDGYIYYRTDHHWTHLGAWIGYREYAKAAGFIPLPLETFHIETWSPDFRGSLFSRSGYFNIKPDTFEILIPKNPQTLRVQYNKGRITDSLYDMDYLDKKDKYSVFMGGNHALVTIETGVENGKKLLVLKDSFANSFAPYLTEHYSEIHVIDLRHYNLEVSTYIEENHINEILVLYNIKSMCEESSIRKLR